MDVAGRARRLVRLGLAGGAGLFGGCAWDAPQSTLVARTDFARQILHVYGIIAWIALGIAAIVVIAIAWILLSFRARPEAGLPRQIRGHSPHRGRVREAGAPPRGAIEVVARGRL